MLWINHHIGITEFLAGTAACTLDIPATKYLMISKCPTKNYEAEESGRYLCQAPLPNARPAENMTTLRLINVFC